MQPTAISEPTRDPRRGEGSASTPALPSVVAAAAVGDAAAFRELYERQGRSVYNMALRSTRDPQTAEDVSQEIWMKVHRDLTKLREPAAFTLWLYRITGKACVDAARRRTRRPASQEIPDEVIDARPGPESRTLDREQSALTWEALATLPAHQHLALFLKEVEGRSYREISRVLDISETAVGLCLLRARRSFQGAFERLQAAASDKRCGYARTTIVTLIDGEANAVQRRAVQAHVDTCRGCAGELIQQRSASRRYAMLALAPVPAALSARIFAAHTAAAAVEAGALAKLIAWGSGMKPAALALTAGTGLTVAALVAPGPAAHDALRSSPTQPVTSASSASSAPHSAGVAGSSPAAEATPGAATLPGAVSTPLAGAVDLLTPNALIATVSDLAKTVMPPLPPVVPPLSPAPNIVPTLTAPQPQLPTPAVPSLAPRIR